MKKIILSLIVSIITVVAIAQDYAKVTLFYSMTGKMEDAKKEIDAIIATPKAQDKAEAYLWKLKVYSEIYADSNLYAKYPDIEMQAMEAFNKYKSLDNSLKLLKEEGGIRSVSLLYSASFNYGRKNFTDTNWEKSYQYFKLAEETGDFINTNNLAQNKINIDTVTVLYTAYAAQNSKKYEEAANYYKKIADLKIGGSDYEDVYRYLLDYYTRQKDVENFNKYLVIAKELYPNSNSVWAQMEMINMNQNTNLEDILNKYRQEQTQGTLTEDKYINYAETFAGPDKSQLDKLDSLKQIEIKMAAADAFAKAFATTPNGLYAFNTGVIKYNMYGILDERYYSYRGETAALKAKRAEIEKDEMIYADTAAVWLEQAYTILKAKTDRTKSETNSLNRTVDYLANIYLWKRDKSKGVNPKDYDKYDAKYKQFDVEHNKYK